MESFAAYEKLGSINGDVSKKHGKMADSITAELWLANDRYKDFPAKKARWMIE
jgi:hypothetical protein